MRTGIYVFEPSTITIEAKDVLDLKAEILRFPERRGQPRLHGAKKVALGTHELQPGIYLVQSVGALQVTFSGSVMIEGFAKDRDQWPDPPPRVLALEEGASLLAVQEFFAQSAPVVPKTPPRAPMGPVAQISQPARDEEPAQDAPPARSVLPRAG